MKKALIIFLALTLVLALLFFWKGGHHAIYLAGVLEDWLDADAADQALTIQIQTPGFETDPVTGQIAAKNRQLSLSAGTFWVEYADRPLLGLTARGMTAWTDGRNLYMDTGKAYALPDLSGLKGSAHRLAVGLLLHGRVTKTGETYHVSMKTEELELDIDLTADRTLRDVTVTAVLPEGAVITGSLIPRPALPHPISREISDAIVRARMEPPMPLTQPLEVLYPALEDLLPLEGDLTLGVECGILNLAETVKFRMNEKTAQLERKGTIATIDLPSELSDAEPAILGLLLLRNGSFIQQGQTTRFEVTLSAQTTNELCTALVPQAGDLGIEFTESSANLTISDGRLTAISLTAGGEVPFLITTIPVSLQAELVVP